MKRHLIQAAICAAAMVCTIHARADVIGSASLSSSQELNPLTGLPPVSSATGTFTLNINPATDAMTFSLTYSGLTSDVTMGHIHLGPPGESGAPIFLLFDYGMPPDVHMTSDTLSGSITPMDFMPDSVDGISTIAQAISAIESGGTYVNIHSADYPAGEIRGQIAITSDGDGSGPGSATTVPEPSSAGLLVLGSLLGCVGVWRRRNRSN